MCRPKLKDLLIRVLALVPFCESHMLTQITAMSEFLEALMICGRDDKVTLSKRWVLVSMFSTVVVLTGVFSSSK